MSTSFRSPTRRGVLAASAAAGAVGYAMAPENALTPRLLAVAIAVAAFVVAVNLTGALDHLSLAALAAN